MVNVHAYKTVYALKEIAEDLLYSPEEVITDENCAEVILQEGFKILLQTKSSLEELKEIVIERFEIRKVDFIVC